MTMANQTTLLPPGIGPIEQEIIQRTWDRQQNCDLTSNEEILARHLDQLSARLTAIESVCADRFSDQPTPTAAHGDRCGDDCNCVCDECLVAADKGT